LFGYSALDSLRTDESNFVRDIRRDGGSFSLILLTISYVTRCHASPKHPSDKAENQSGGGQDTVTQFSARRLLERLLE
jgi:hypothetical protein